MWKCMYRVIDNHGHIHIIYNISLDNALTLVFSAWTRLTHLLPPLIGSQLLCTASLGWLVFGLSRHLWLALSPCAPPLLIGSLAGVSDAARSSAHLSHTRNTSWSGGRSRRRWCFVYFYEKGNLITGDIQQYARSGIDGKPHEIYYIARVSLSSNMSPFTSYRCAARDYLHWLLFPASSCRCLRTELFMEESWQRHDTDNWITRQDARSGVGSLRKTLTDFMEHRCRHGRRYTVSPLLRCMCVSVFTMVFYAF